LKQPVYGRLAGDETSNSFLFGTGSVSKSERDILKLKRYVLLAQIDERTIPCQNLDRNPYIIQIFVPLEKPEAPKILAKSIPDWNNSRFEYPKPSMYPKVPLTFETVRAEEDGGIQVFGTPYFINASIMNPTDLLLFQYDPLAVEEGYFHHFDGVLCFFIPIQDYQKGNFQTVYAVLDRL
jgi:hypothetical protein